MAKLTGQQKEFFSNMETTFATGGWALLTQGWTEERDSLQTAVFFGAKSLEDVTAARNRFSLLSDLIALPETIDKQRQAILDDEGQEEPYV